MDLPRSGTSYKSASMALNIPRGARALTDFAPEGALSFCREAALT